MTLLPSGKGFYIWKAVFCEGGDIAKIVQQALLAGFGHVLVKIADGVGPYNVSIDLVALVKALKAAGLQVWGWHYVYGYNPGGEAAKAVEMLAKTGCDGYIIDAEVEYKYKPAAATAFITRLRDLLGDDFPIGLASYRYPSYHQEFPWKEFRAGCSFDMPQVYWEGAQNAAEQLARSYGEFSKMSPKLPYVPSGSAYVNGSWAPSEQSVQGFLNQALSMGFEGVNFWEWMNTRRDLPALWDVIANFDWPGSTPGPEPEEDDMSLENLKAWRAKQAMHLAEGTQLLGELDAIIAEMDAQPAPTPEPTPEPAPIPSAVWNMIVKNDPRAKTWCFEVWNANKQELVEKRNDAKKPIMQEYYDRNGDRLTYDKGVTVQTYRVVTDADSTADYHELYGVKGDRGQRLFILKDHLMKLV